MKNRNGFIYNILLFLFSKLKYFNIVEFFKYLATINEKQKDRIIHKKNISIDVFNIVKYSFLLIAIIFSWYSNFALLLVIYLLIMNIYTYFFYHFWETKPCRDLHHLRNRFLKLVFSFTYNILSFWYLYIYLGDYHFSALGTSKYDFLQLSLASSFSAPTLLHPSTLIANYIVTFQVIVTFIYVAILLTQTLSNSKE